MLIIESEAITVSINKSVRLPFERFIEACCISVSSVTTFTGETFYQCYHAAPFAATGHMNNRVNVHNGGSIFAEDCNICIKEYIVIGLDKKVAKHMNLRL